MFVAILRFIHEMNVKYALLICSFKLKSRTRSQVLGVEVFF
jgi:hypothetical protein